MVGLPARGKTYISKKLTRYLNWIGVPTKGEPVPKGKDITVSAMILLASPPKLQKLDLLPPDASTYG